jgi:hypothetical protein
MINNEEKLWKLFSNILVSTGLNPETYREDFEEEYQKIKNESPGVQEKIVRALAKFAVAYRSKHPLPPSIPAMRKVLQIREEMDKAKERVNPSDGSSIELYIQKLRELKRQEEKVWHDLELRRSEIKAKGLRETGRKIISIACLKCRKPLKYVIEFERGLCLECYNRL